MEEKKDKVKPEEKKEGAKKKEKDGLNDIILDKLNANKKPKSIKKILLGISSMILLFLVVLLVMKFINSSNEKEGVALIPPKDSTKASVIEESKKTESKKEDEDIFKKAPIEAEEQTPSKEIEEEDNFDEMVKSLKEKEIASQKQEQKVKASTAKEESSINKAEIEKQIKKEVEPPKNETKKPEAAALAKENKKAKKEIIKADHNIKAPKVVKPKKEVVKTSVSCPTPIKVNKVKGYFIQVSASFKTLPTKEFLRKIEKNGFRYIIKKSVVRGQRATKVLVGPYSTKEKALKDLPKVKEIINPDAFILRMK